MSLQLSILMSICCPSQYTCFNYESSIYFKVAFKHKSLICFKWAFKHRSPISKGLSNTSHLFQMGFQTQVTYFKGAFKHKSPISNGLSNTSQSPISKWLSIMPLTNFKRPFKQKLISFQTQSLICFKMAFKHMLLINFNVAFRHNSIISFKSNFKHKSI